MRGSMNSDNVLLLLLISFVFAAESMQKPPDAKPAVYTIAIHNRSGQDLLLWLSGDISDAYINILKRIPLKSGATQTVVQKNLNGISLFVKNIQGDQQIQIYNKMEGKISKSLTITGPEQLQEWATSLKNLPEHEKTIDIFLHKRKNGSMLNALNAVQEKRLQLKSAPPTPAPNLEQVLKIQPHSIEKNILDLAQAKNWDGLEKLIKGISDFDVLKKLVLFQMDIALLVANQLLFEIKDTRAFDEYSPVISNMSDYDAYTQIKIQWIGLLLLWQTSFRSHNQDLESALRILHYFLDDLGHLMPEIPVTIKKTELQNMLASNFKKLFELLNVAVGVNPKIGPWVDLMKKALKIA